MKKFYSSIWRLYNRDRLTKPKTSNHVLQDLKLFIDVCTSQKHFSLLLSGWVRCCKNRLKFDIFFVDKFFLVHYCSSDTWQLSDSAPFSQRTLRQNAYFVSMYLYQSRHSLRKNLGQGGGLLSIHYGYQIEGFVLMLVKNWLTARTKSVTLWISEKNRRFAAVCGGVAVH